MHTTKLFAEGLGMNYAYGIEFLELWGRNENEVGYHGNAVCSRFPLENVRMLRFPGIEKWFKSGEHRLGGRNAIFAEIESSVGRILLCSTHLESGFSDYRARAQESRMILDEVEAHGGELPIIIGGDMNARPTEPAMIQFAEAGFPPEETALLDIPTSQRVVDGKAQLVGFTIDYVLARGLEVNRGEHSPATIMATWPNTPEGKHLADHAIVAAEFKL